MKINGFPTDGACPKDYLKLRYDGANNFFCGTDTSGLNMDLDNVYYVGITYVVNWNGRNGGFRMKVCAICN